MDSYPPDVVYSIYRSYCNCGNNSVPFAVMYSGISRTPLWSAEHLTRESILDAKDLKGRAAFHPEGELPSNERAELSDYARSGFDRGHMAPSADMPNRSARQQCFSLANMIQHHCMGSFFVFLTGRIKTDSVYGKGALHADSFGVSTGNR